MPRRKRSRPLAILILPLLALFILSACVAGGLLLKLPEQVEGVFGPPATWLTARQRIWYSILLIAQEKDLTTPNQAGGVEVDFSVAQGESVASITGRLWEAGLISNPGAFRTYLLYSGLDTTLKAGNYRFSPDLSPVELAQGMQSAVSSQVIFGILPGWRAEEVAAALPGSGLEIDPAAFLQAVQSVPDEYAIQADLPRASLEGFLFPTQYELPRTAKLEELLTKVYAAFDASVTREMRAAYDRQGLSLYQAVILASIVEREAVVEEEMPMIASVFYNRLAAGMKLESDPTAQYARGYNQEQGTWWTNPLSLADLHIDSPYNTYVYAGLPPGPISNPGLAALRAVAFPAQTPYYYFRAACDDTGMHNFSETYEEHLGNACP